MKQTTIQNPEAIRKGSVRVLVGDDFNNLVDVGALRNPVFTSMAEIQQIDFDNVDPLRKFVKGQRVQITFDLAEINFPNLAALSGGLINLSATAGSPVNVDGEEHGIGWVVGVPFKLNHKNGDDTIVSSIVVYGGSDTLVNNTDYDTYVGDGQNGEKGATYIVPLTSEAGAITVDYTYTPNAKRTITLNDAGASVLKCLRIINEDENGKEFKIDIEDGTNFAPISVDFAGDEEDDVAILPVDFQGNLVEWTDEQAA
mgnify:CR=1 FL=1